ncbi:MAG TPA: chemotaxis response regulator protein-glutamate methylesterase [Gemmatimonadaceae bacterium]|nr:chemotaxis response regulator protein-glutamate methylesterase [Gemmatimonadaceae bacterium]
MSRARVLVVDDSAFMRRQLVRMLESDPAIEVVGTARHGAEALERVAELSPDVVTLDINMPVMDGLTALAHLMETSPLPVVMISSLTQEGAGTAVEALTLGAVDCVGKPSGTVSLDIEQQAQEIREKVRAAARCTSTRLRARASRRVLSGAARTRIATARQVATVEGAVAIGVSTGGPQTLLEILPMLPEDLPVPVLIVQHMPPNFTASLARRLDEACALRVREAAHQERLEAGTVYVAPGGTHLHLARSALRRGLVAQLRPEPAEHQFRPSVDVLFGSVAEVCGATAIGVLLTGMGDDGADGMVALAHAGAHTIAESEESAIVFGMPREAIERGGAREVVPARRVAASIVHSLSHRR